MGQAPSSPSQQHRRARRPSERAAAAAAGAAAVDQALNPAVAALRPSKTMALTDAARAMREQGIDVIGLAAGEPDFDTPEAIVEAGIEALRTGQTRYTPNTGTSALRAAIAAKLRDDNGLTYDPASEIVVSNGAKQAIWQALLATVSPGDEVIIPAPYWVSYPEMARLAGAEPVVLETRAEDGWVLSAERLRAALTPKSRLLILCTPSNPTGAVYSLEQLRAVADVVREHPRLLVLSDEIYESITYAPARHHSFAALDAQMFGRTLTVNGFSKAFAMTGWRLGYLAAPRRFASAAAVIQSQSTSGASSIAQHAAVAALALGPRGGAPVEAMVREFEQRRDLVAAALAAIPGVSLPTPPQGAFYALPDVSALVGPGAEAEGFGPVPDADALAEYLLRQARVATVPGSAFGAPACLRLSYAASEETLREALRRVAEALEAPRYRRPG